jgi:hypothetical protein
VKQTVNNAKENPQQMVPFLYLPITSFLHASTDLISKTLLTTAPSGHQFFVFPLKQTMEKTDLKY